MLINEKIRWKLFFISMIILSVLCACHKKNVTDSVDNKSANPMRPGQIRSLALEGYNYTNNYIHYYSVDGQGGGNLRVSGPSSGGGGTVCCVQYTVGHVGTVKVRWQVGGCLFDEGMDKNGEMAQQIHHFYKEEEVRVDPNIPVDPHYFEVHIYPDGHVKTIITEESSIPHLILSKDREIDSFYPRCPDGKKPKN